MGMLRLRASGGPGRLSESLARVLAVRVWSPHAATTVIGITFFFMLLAVGAWAYTDVLAELARGMAGNLVARTLLLGALFSGAMLGGYTAGRFRSTPVSLTQLAKCFAGGVLMGWGSLLIPGGNDGLILVGIPLLWPYAWLAFFTMCAVIGIALVVEKNMIGHGAEQAVH
jgi:toxin CptA